MKRYQIKVKRINHVINNNQTQSGINFPTTDMKRAVGFIAKISHKVLWTVGHFISTL